MTSDDRPSQFYTGLVADLYEPLVSVRSRADDYIPFLQRSGTPALELACGSGLPLIELVERGFDVHGLDASHDMLERCRARARERGVDVTLHLAEMQSFSLPTRYRSMFLAGASFTLLTTDDDAARALDCMHAHLEPGGSLLIPIESGQLQVDPNAARFTREIRTESGERLRLTMLALDFSPDQRVARRQLRYERISTTGETECVERDFQQRSWSQEQFRELLRAARFDKVTFLAPQGGRAEQDANNFVALARKAAP